MDRLMSRVELLSPAGDMECFYAALSAGADAVYLGLDKYSARASAVNFTEEELLGALDLAHLHDARIYLTVNTLFKDSEIDDLYDLLYRPYINGLDGVIVQDFGVMGYIRANFPGLSVHASTQAAVTGVDGVKLLQRYGVTRVVPARELSLREIIHIIDETGAEIECFIHGSLCYSYSGKCLLSSFIGGRSGNRGRCAQPCRLKYDDAYLLSLKDLCTIDILPKLIGCGIRSFKIEGRMKSKDYVYGVTSIYRKYIDMYYNGSYEVDDSDRKRLISYYTRGGNCEGYYNRHNSPDMITVDSPSYRTEDSGCFTPGLNERLKIPVRIGCNVLPGKNVTVNVEGKGCSVSVVTDIIAEPSVKRPVTKEEITKQLEKSGDTYFKAKASDVYVVENVFLTKAMMNGIRRAGLDAISDKILCSYRRYKEYLRPKRQDIHDRSDFGRNREVRVSVLSLDQLKAVAKSPCDGVIIPTSLLSRQNIDIPGLNCKKIYISLPYVIRDDGRSNSPSVISETIRKCLKSYEIRGAYVSNLESIAILKRAGFRGTVTADIHLYAYNRLSKDFFDTLDVETTVPVELNEKELRLRKITNEDLIVYGRIPMMVCANCIYSEKNGCQRSDEDGHGFYITDRKGQRPYVKCFCNECTTVIYNSMKTCITDESELIKNIAPSSLRFVFTDESEEETARVLDAYYSAKSSGGGRALIDTYTKGHLNRGVD